jgi:hypothetical protein
MYRKALTLVAVFFSTFAIATVAYGADSQGTLIKPRHKHVVASVQESGKKPTSFPVSMPPSFEDADTNEDGEIEPTEAEAIGISFSALDMNGDGVVTHSEYDIATAPYYSRAAIEPRHKQ